jgi:hypothetical protein
MGGLELNILTKIIEWKHLTIIGEVIIVQSLMGSSMTSMIIAGVIGLTTAHSGQALQ